MNPLLNPDQLTDYGQLTPELALEAINASVAGYRQGIQRVIQHQSALPTWDDLVLAVDALDADLQGVFYALAPMNSHGEKWAQVFEQAGSLIGACFDEKLRNSALYNLYRQLTNSAIGQQLGQHQKTTLALILKDYENGGVLLGDDDKARLQSLQQQIHQLEGQFIKNLDLSVEALSVHIDEERRLQGLPAYLVEQMREAAQASVTGGWLIVCNLANFTAVLKYAQDRSLREQVYRAYLTRGTSDDSQTDNGAVIQAIAALRDDKARLLGFDNHVQFSLQTKSIGTLDDLKTFLQGLEQRIRPKLEAADQRLGEVAAEQGINVMMPWDMEYLHARSQSVADGMTEAQMQEYFTLDGVVAALTDLAGRLFGLSLLELDSPKAWHPSVRTYEVIKDHASIGYLYLDALQHEYKAPDTVQTAAHWHRRIDAEGRYHRAVVAVFSDVAPGANGLPPLLDHLALKKLFHEFGHALQNLLVRTGNHLLSDVRRLGNDGVEVAGRLFECWTWDADYLASISAHYQHGQKLESADLRGLLAKLGVSTGLEAARSLGWALLDLDLHASPKDGRNLQSRVQDSWARAGLRLAGFEQPLHGFDYLVRGYDAAFYGYLWASAHGWDLFTRFEAVGLLDRQIGASLLERFFAPSVSRHFSQSFEAFLGRPMDPSRFLKWSGLE